ncbi:hypothetical protein CC80DRAFT_91070 [Byssothecium circinans]|uniref:Uncharacterized protein n=1 Tax=Byssothecium circinans TaxID=147558 RepID=A0A6A5TRF9_9PLEO|nr:hypothetical protein CC80DRAFT_91070 [Byssothecium circinans]
MGWDGKERDGKLSSGDCHCIIRGLFGFKAALLTLLYNLSCIELKGWWVRGREYMLLLLLCVGFSTEKPLFWTVLVMMLWFFVQDMAVKEHVFLFLMRCAR